MNFKQRNIESQDNLNSVFFSVEFQDLLKTVKERTVMPSSKLCFVYELARNYRDYPAAEIGVYRGGSAYIIATQVKQPVYLIDTFEGLPDVCELDSHKKGQFSETSFESVANFLKPFGNVSIIKGLFNEAKTMLPARNYGFVHLDVDIYMSTLDCLNFFYDKVIPGGAILIDDYDGKNTIGCKKAVDIFLSDKPECCITLGTVQGLIIKR